MCEVKLDANEITNLGKVQAGRPRHHKKSLTMLEEILKRSSLGSFNGFLTVFLDCPKRLVINNVRVIRLTTTAANSLSSLFLKLEVFSAF